MNEHFQTLVCLRPKRTWLVEHTDQCCESVSVLPFKNQTEWLTDSDSKHETDQLNIRSHDRWTIPAAKRFAVTLKGCSCSLKVLMEKVGTTASICSALHMYERPTLHCRKFREPFPSTNLSTVIIYKNINIKNWMRKDAKKKVKKNLNQSVAKQR